MKKANSIFRLDNKVALIVGAASGIGRAAAIALADSGAAGVCADLQLEGAQKTADEIATAGGKAVAWTANSRRGESGKAASAQIQAAFKTSDVLVPPPAVNVRK